VFPMPIDIIKPFLDLREKAAKPALTNGADHPAPAILVAPIASPSGAA
jgi:hypothetical protein